MCCKKPEALQGARGATDAVGIVGVLLLWLVAD